MTWIELKNELNIKNFLDQFGYFHDGCLKEMHIWTGTYVNEDLSMTVPGELDTNVKILFQRQMNDPSAIELLFEGVTDIHITPSPENYDSIIYEAIIFKNKNNYYWSNNVNFHPEKGIEEGWSWIGAKKLKYREVSHWLGKENRYG